MAKLSITKPDLEVILGGGSLLEAVTLFRRMTGMDLRMSKDLVEKFRGGRLAWRDYFDAADPCGACEGTGFAKPYAVGQQVAPGLVMVRTDTLRALQQQLLEVHATIDKEPGVKIYDVIKLLAEVLK